jgi:hypothetical protein
MSASKRPRVVKAQQVQAEIYVCQEFTRPFNPDLLVVVDGKTGLPLRIYATPKPPAETRRSWWSRLWAWLPFGCAQGHSSNERRG